MQQPIDFEGKTYNEIDLSKLENLSATDLGKIENLYQNKYPGEIGIVKEFSSNYYAVIDSMKEFERKFNIMMNNRKRLGYSPI